MLPRRIGRDLRLISCPSLCSSEYALRSRQSQQIRMDDRRADLLIARSLSHLRKPSIVQSVIALRYQGVRKRFLRNDS